MRTEIKEAEVSMKKKITKTNVSLMEEEEKPSVFLHKKHDIVIGVIMTLILLFLTYKAYQYDGTETEKYTFWFTEKANLPVAIGCCLAAGFLMNIRFPWKIYNLVRSFIAVTVIPFLAILFLQYYTIDPWGEKPIYPKMLLCNAVFYYLIYLLVVFIAGSFSLGYMISTAFFMAVGMANYFIMQFRGSPIVPWDFFSLGTAFSVADNYSYEITWRFMHATFAFVFMLILSQKITWKPKKMIIRIPAVCLSLGLLVFAGKELQKTSVKDWLGMDQTLFTPTVRYRNNGFLAAFVGNLHLIDVQKPDGYSADKVKEVQTKIENSDTYREETAATANFDISKAPNIIVIMDEAFSDLSARGSFEVSEDPIPFFHKMQEENAGGKLMVSVKGGNTANTEWEFLSGDTMAFLPTGSVVFQQFIHDNVPALPAYLASLGYSTTAIHPYRGSGWNRDKVYPMIGFQQFLTQDDFVNPKYLRNFISDESAFDKIIEQFKTNKDSGKPQFIFEVTMQNHSGYTIETFNGFEPTITLTGQAQTTQVRAAEEYLSLTNYTDQALEKMMEYFETVDEPTIIVMFGDHQPSDYVTQVIDRITGYNPESEDPEEAQKSYLVPYFIWNNYGLTIEDRDLTSVNYLAQDILKAAGLPMTEYQIYLNELQNTLQAVAGGAYVDKDGNYYTYDEDSQYMDLINEYNILEYNHLTDTDHRVLSLFTRDTNLNQIVQELAEGTTEDG